MPQYQLSPLLKSLVSGVMLAIADAEVRISAQETAKGTGRLVVEPKQHAEHPRS
jgi:hypothetical protein